MAMKKYVIIVAGGSGSRFGSTIPKQFVPICDEPILMRAIRAFHRYDPSMGIVVALPAEYVSLWNDLCISRKFTIRHRITEGGGNRFESVKKALFSIADTDCLVAVHDGARPLVTTAVIAAGFETAERCGTAVPFVPVTDSVRQLDRNGSHAVSRESLVAVQTPQIFRMSLLKDAYTAAYSPFFTDDASVAEYRGAEITLFPGDADNIKITHPIDLKTAEWILSTRSDEQA